MWVSLESVPLRYRNFWKSVRQRFKFEVLKWVVNGWILGLEKLAGDRQWAGRQNSDAGPSWPLGVTDAELQKYK